MILAEASGDIPVLLRVEAKSNVTTGADDDEAG